MRNPQILLTFYPELSPKLSTLSTKIDTISTSNLNLLTATGEKEEKYKKCGQGTLPKCK